MAAKLKLTRPELKRYRDEMVRYEHYLPMLKLKQQQLQLKLRVVAQERREIERAADEADARFRRYEAILAERAGIPLRQMAVPASIRTSQANVAGVEIPVFEDVVFSEVRYSLFSTSPWVDQAVADLRECSMWRARLDVIRTQERRLSRELTRLIQRVNLFEKIKIPEAREAIRLIRIKLGDEMAAAVGRAKIAKSKLAETVNPDKRAPSDATGKLEPDEVDLDADHGQEGAGS